MPNHSSSPPNVNMAWYGVMWWCGELFTPLTPLPLRSFIDPPSMTSTMYSSITPKERVSDVISSSLPRFISHSPVYLLLRA